MNVTREPGESKPAAIVITGNGKQEYKLLRAIAKKHNGLKTLWFPIKPLPTHGAGLRSLKILKIYTKYSGSFLLLIDREHLKTKTEEEIKNTLEEIGVNVKSITQPSEGSFIVRGSTGTLHNHPVLSNLWKNEKTGRTHRQAHRTHTRSNSSTRETSNKKNFRQTQNTFRKSNQESIS